MKLLSLALCVLGLFLTVNCSADKDRKETDGATQTANDGSDDVGSDVGSTDGGSMDSGKGEPTVSELGQEEIDEYCNGLVSRYAAIAETFLSSVSQQEACVMMAFFVTEGWGGTPQDCEDFVKECISYPPAWGDTVDAGTGDLMLSCGTVEQMGSCMATKSEIEACVVINVDLIETINKELIAAYDSISCDMVGQGVTINSSTLLALPEMEEPEECAIVREKCVFE